jgi:phosphoglycolate phosphatase
MTFEGSTPTGGDAVVLDLDGTLVDTMGDFELALNAMLREFGLPRIGPAEIGRMVGKGSPHLVRSVLAHFRADPALGERALESYLAHYAQVNGTGSVVYPGVMEGLRALAAQGLRLVCLTNKPTALARTLLGAKGLSPFFEGIYGGDLFERTKPDPLPLLKTCEALGTVPSRTLMIGDSSNDARSARAAGCPVVLVTYGYNHGEPVRAVDADAFVDSLVEAAGLVRPDGPAVLP